MADEQLGKKSMDRIIKRLRDSPNFNTQELAKTAASLLSCSRPYITTTPLFSAKSNGVKYYYNRSVIDSIKILLDKFYDEMIWEYDENNGKIEGPMNTLGVLEYEKKKKALEKALHGDQKYKIILPYFFLDDFQLYIKRRTTALGIYMSNFY